MSAPPGAVATLTRTTKSLRLAGGPTGRHDPSPAMPSGFRDYVDEVRAFALREHGHRLSRKDGAAVARSAYVRQYVDEPLELTGDLHCPHLDPVGEAVVNAMVRRGDMNRHAA